ncbi:hypothetical protein IAR50_004851 [Cryptococcus sp. DSM 104548]
MSQFTEQSWKAEDESNDADFVQDIESSRVVRPIQLSNDDLDSLGVSAVADDTTMLVFSASSCDSFTKTISRKVITAVRSGYEGKLSQKLDLDEDRNSYLQSCVVAGNVDILNEKEEELFVRLKSEDEAGNRGIQLVRAVSSDAVEEVWLGALEAERHGLRLDRSGAGGIVSNLYSDDSEDSDDSD